MFTDRRVRAGIYAVITAFHSFTISSTHSFYTRTHFLLLLALFFFWSATCVFFFAFTPWLAHNYLVTGVSMSPLDISHDEQIQQMLAESSDETCSLPRVPHVYHFPLLKKISPLFSIFTPDSSLPHSLLLSLYHSFPGTSRIHLAHFCFIS